MLGMFRPRQIQNVLRVLIKKVLNRVWILCPLFIFEKDPKFGQKAIISELLQFYTRGFKHSDAFGKARFSFSIIYKAFLPHR